MTLIPHIICSEIWKPVLQCQQEMYFICSFQLTPFILQKMLTVNIRNDFLLKISKQQDCPERETQVASDLILSEMKPLCELEVMTDARILSYGSRIFSQGFMENIAEQQKKDIFIFIFYFFWIILYRHACFVFGKTYIAYFYYVGKLHMFQRYAE